MNADPKVTLLASALLFAVPFPAPAQDKPWTTEQAREEHAYTVGVQAYVYGFPVVEMYRVRHRQVFDPTNKDRTPLNQFFHRRQLLDHTAKLVVLPNNDTLYSSAWLDLAREPVVLQVPDTRGRYHVFQLMDFYTNNFAFVGTRATGNGGGTFAITGPGWRGTLPEGLKRIDSPTNAIWLLGRTLVDGPDDLKAVHALQDRYALTPLSAWGKKEGPAVPAKRPDLPPFDLSEPLSFFTILNAGLRENPPPAREAALMSLFGQVGVGPDKTFQPDRLDPAVARGLRRALTAGRQIVAANRTWEDSEYHGWSGVAPGVGTYGDDYLLRAAIALRGLAALSPEEAVYLQKYQDDQGQPLQGKKKYLIRFEKGRHPPVVAFWSITTYRLPERLLAANPIQRFAVGDRTRGLRTGADGALEIYVQHESPGQDKEANWLPAPEGPFFLSLRLYLPRKEALDRTWKPPAVKHVP